jgi:hypothetical protein
MKPLRKSGWSTIARTLSSRQLLLGFPRRRSDKGSAALLLGAHRGIAEHDRDEPRGLGIVIGEQVGEHDVIAPRDEARPSSLGSRERSGRRAGSHRADARSRGRGHRENLLPGRGRRASKRHPDGAVTPKLETHEVMGATPEQDDRGGLVRMRCHRDLVDARASTVAA